MEENTEGAWLAILNSPTFVRSILRQIISQDGEDAVEDENVLTKYGLDECPDKVIFQARIGLW